MTQVRSLPRLQRLLPRVLLVLAAGQFITGVAAVIVRFDQLRVPRLASVVQAAPLQPSLPPPPEVPPPPRPSPQVLFDIPGWRTAPGPPMVALTFDDGPDPTYTPQILAILASRQVRATFFFVGELAAHHPALVQQTAASGHTIGGHTWSHAHLTRLDDAGFAAEVDRADDLLASITHRPIACVRPPYGHFDAGVVQRLDARGLITMMWSVDPWDWSRPGTAAVTERVVAGLRPGAVVLMHDAGGNRAQTVAALPAILDAILARGYRVMPICG
jgi:peptidoglycan-N-acetylglucosamine deacetylase